MKKMDHKKPRWLLPIMLLAVLVVAVAVPYLPVGPVYRVATCGECFAGQGRPLPQGANLFKGYMGHGRLSAATTLGRAPLPWRHPCPACA